MRKQLSSPLLRQFNFAAFINVFPFTHHIFFPFFKLKNKKGKQRADYAVGHGRKAEPPSLQIISWICTIPNFFTVLGEKYSVVIHWSSYSAWRVNSMWSLTYLSMHMVMHYLFFWAEATPPKTHGDWYLWTYPVHHLEPCMGILHLWFFCYYLSLMLQLHKQEWFVYWFR